MIFDIFDILKIFLTSKIFETFETFGISEIVSSNAKQCLAILSNAKHAKAKQC